jgi:hypothetical protein
VAAQVVLTVPLVLPLPAVRLVLVLLAPVVLPLRLDLAVRYHPKAVRKAPWGPGRAGFIYYPRARKSN